MNFDGDSPVLEHARGRRILLTGGAGQIGMMATRRLLELGGRPIVYDLQDSPFLSDVRADVVMVKGDLLDLNRLRRTMVDQQVEAVIHLAKNPGTAELDPLLTLRINCLGSANVLEAAREAGIGRVVYSSSKSVYAKITGHHAPPDFVPITEDFPKFGRGDEDYVPFYSTTNKMVEYFGIRFAKKYKMEFVILRFGNSWGPGKLQTYARPNQSLLKGEGTYACMMIESAYRGSPLEFDEGADQRDNLVYNGDLADGIIAAAVSNRIQFDGGWREIHLDWGYPLSLGDVAHVLKARYPGNRVRVGPGPFSSVEHRKGECVFDLSRARAELHYQPRYTLDSAIDHYISMLEAAQ